MNGVIEGSAIEAWMPHRGEMRLIDRLLVVDEVHAVAEVDVPLDGLFVRDGQVAAWVGIEYMAQTVAAWAGARARRYGWGSYSVAAATARAAPLLPGAALCAWKLVASLSATTDLASSIAASARKRARC